MKTFAFGFSLNSLAFAFRVDFISFFEFEAEDAAVEEEDGVNEADGAMEEEAEEEEVVKGVEEDKVEGAEEEEEEELERKELKAMEGDGEVVNDLSQ